MSLNCDASGRPTEFEIRIPAHRKVAFVSRTVGPRAPKTTPNPQITSPQAEFVGEEYLQDGGKIVGELPAGGNGEVEQWNALVVDRRASAQPGG
jgi:hypothetical protein